MPNWNCSSSLCFNTFRSGLKPYRLPRKPDIQREYKRLFKTEGWNWKDGYICPEPVAVWQGVQGVQCTPQKDLRGAPKELFKGAPKFC